MLRFRPNGLGNSEEPWLLEPKRNACVGCGVAQEAAAHGLMRWSVVPPSFRSLLPEAHKSRDSHDIVLLCSDCHDLLVRPYAARRASLFAAHGIAPDTARTVDDPHLQRVRSAGRALSGRQASRLPEGRRRDLEAVLASHFGVERVGAETVAEAARVRVTRERDDWTSPEALLVSGLLESGDANEAIRQLQATWRQTFVDAVAPRHLPLGWSVHHDAFAEVAARRDRRESLGLSGSRGGASATGGDDSEADQPGVDFIDARLHNASTERLPPPPTCG